MGVDMPPYYPVAGLRDLDRGSSGMILWGGCSRVGHETVGKSWGRAVVATVRAFGQLRTTHEVPCSVTDRLTTAAVRGAVQAM